MSDYQENWAEIEQDIDVLGNLLFIITNSFSRWFEATTNISI